jgi:microcystin degradation protein MlrC
MGAESELDPEGALLAGVRRIIGDASPIVISLDLHGILTDRMLANINGLTAYKTYPHVDFANPPGARAARLLVDIVKGRVDPIIVRTPIPALVRGNELLTETGCYGALIDDVQNLERTKQCLSAGLLIGNPFTDVPELCSQVFVVTDRDERTAQDEAARLARTFWGQRRRMQAQLVNLDAAITEAKAMPSPVIFTDAADATSSGASGDSVEIVKALVEANFAGRILAPVVDRPAAEVAHRAGVGATVEVTVGASLDKRFSSLPLTAEVAVLSDGRARSETSGHRMDAGQSAVLVADNLTLLVMSRSERYPDWRIAPRRRATAPSLPSPSSAAFAPCLNVVVGVGRHRVPCLQSAPKDVRHMSYDRLLYRFQWLFRGCRWTPLRSAFSNAEGNTVSGRYLDSPGAAR